MKKYTRSQARFKDLKNLDNVFTRAAANVVLSMDSGTQPNIADLEAISDGFKKIFGRYDPKSIFGSRLGLVIPIGRPKEYGFTSSDIVSAVVELHKRKTGCIDAVAKNYALQVFEDISGSDAARQISRDWEKGRATVSGLTTQELENLVEPYEV